MKHTYHILYLLAFVPLLAFWGCESDDMPGSGQGELVPVTVRLTTSAPEEIQTRADNTASLVEDDYKVSTLKIYITDGSSTITLNQDNFTFDGTDETSYEGTSKKTIQLINGKTYQVYALANTTEDIDYDSNPFVNAISMVNATDKTVPMSAKTEWTIDGSTETVTLTRMVAQMKVSIVMGDGDGAETTATTSTISDFKIEKLLPSQTSLYAAEGSFSLPANIGDLTDWSWQDAKVGEENTTSFYLHETSGTFTVSLNDGTRTRSNTFTRTVQRNQILPLVIHLSDYRLDFNGSSYQHGPIGVIKNPLISGYTIELPEGASAVNLKVALKNADNVAIAGVDWSYELTQTGTLTKLELGELSADENDILTILDNYNFSAGLTGTITLELKATFTDSGKTKTQLFPITINVVSIEEATTRANAPTRPIVVEL